MPGNRNGLDAVPARAKSIEHPSAPEGAAAGDAVDARRLTDWLVSRHGDHVGPFAWSRIAGGRSNITLHVTDARGHAFILRRPPEGPLLASAHDVLREFRILSALRGQPVPTPAPLALCESPSILGAPFYTMAFEPGLVLRSPDDTAGLSDGGRARVGHAMIDVLADLHGIDPEAVGLGTLGRRDGYLERQLTRWHRQWQSSSTRRLPALDEAHQRLTADIPRQQRVSIVHGDFRLDNVVLGPQGDVRAVLDWELCTLGDPLADLGLFLVYWTQPGEDTSHLYTSVPTTTPGFATRDELVERYRERTDLDLDRIGFYMAFGLWKLACIGEGICVRDRAAGLDVGTLSKQVGLLAEKALTTLRGSS
ncbi:phosphotransferase family protein [Nocardioides acrostichi]|uniref:Phosphotransferase family protein n=1 Tax=Nocardioides acrostichi TaxID=2784339 RepID=A0A930Y516_9ACTN|nr:phosphotransferase family protein [Nocardioides acrostichi]MBF4160790.1 phosphotransferase family protein [Nocardioides acrostichi]